MIWTLCGFIQYLCSYKRRNDSRYFDYIGEHNHADHTYLDRNVEGEFYVRLEMEVDGVFTADTNVAEPGLLGHYQWYVINALAIREVGDKERRCAVEWRKKKLKLSCIVLYARSQNRRSRVHSSPLYTHNIYSMRFIIGVMYMFDAFSSRLTDSKTSSRVTDKSHTRVLFMAI